MSSVALTTACADSDTPAINRAANGVQSNASRNMNQSTAQNPEVKTDPASLGKIINLPVRPSEVQWTEEIFDNSKGTVPGPSDQRLAALLKFDEKGTAELVRKLAAETSEKSIGGADVKAWFPDEVKNAAKTTDGRTKIEGAKYSPTAFYSASYRNGNLIRVGETDYFILNLTSF